MKKGNRYIVDCKMESNEAACEWLDKLLVNKNIKDFRIPGAQNGLAPKMKVFIDCQLAIWLILLIINLNDYKIEYIENNIKTIILIFQLYFITFLAALMIVSALGTTFSYRFLA